MNLDHIKQKLSNFMWGVPSQGESALCATVKFLTMCKMRSVFNFLCIKLGERSVEYEWILRNVGRAKRNSKLLDVGCGYSRLDCVFYYLGYDTYAIDVNKPPYVYKQIKFIRGDIVRSSFKNNFFDIIVAISTLEHIGLGAYKDPIYGDGDLKAVEEMKRILKNHGLLLITGPFASKPIMTWHRFYDPRRLELLKSGFLVLKEDYYINKRKWIKVNMSEAIEYVNNYGPFNPIGGPNAVFCMKLQKEG